MLGGQQIRAYKTIMKKSRYLPRHSEDDVRLYRVIAWGAVIILAAFIAVIVAAKIARSDFTSEPVFVFVIPIALGLLFCWWWIDVAPAVSRWLVASGALSREAWQQIRAGAGKENDPEDT